jgi:hypothetical protein
MPFLQDNKTFTALMDEIGSPRHRPICGSARSQGLPILRTSADYGLRGDERSAVQEKRQASVSSGDLLSIEIMKEYGPDNLYFRKSDITAGKAEDGIFHITILDDILATGGTAEGIANALDKTRLSSMERNMASR